MDLKLTGKKALVFGSTSGIGKATAISLIREGAEVYINGRTPDKCKAVQEEIGAAGFYNGDLTQPGTAAEITKLMLSEVGCIDILVTNTGGPKKGDFLEIDLAQWQKDYQSIYLSVVEALQIVIPSMQKNNFGRVLMVTSLAAREPRAGLTTSNGLRPGLAGLARTLSNEFAKDGLTFNLILPGFTNTDRLKGLNLTEETIKSMVPAGRLADPSELGDLAAYLASPLASYITAQSITIDGGVNRSL